MNEMLRDWSPRWLQRGVVVVLAGLLVGTLVLRARLVTTLNINWDEFYFLSRIHAYLRGDLGDRLLTFHVHLFSWVPSTSTSEIDQIFVLRAIMFGCGVATVAAITWLGRCVLGSLAAGLFASIACASFSLVLQFGNSARFDPPIVALFLVAAALIVSERRRLLLVAGALCAVGVLISIKFALYLPTLAALFVARGLAGRHWRTVLRDGLSFAAVVVVVAGALGALHVASLSPTSPGVGGGLVAIGSKMTSTVFSFPQHHTLLQSLRWDWATWVFITLGLIVTALDLRRSGMARARGGMVLAFAIPLLAISSYRNAFPYFYVTVIPPASLLAGALYARIEQALRVRGWAAIFGAATVALAAPMVWGAWRWCDANSHDQVAPQRIVLEAVHHTFPQPVSYIDRCGMVSSFPKAGLFMSTWSLEDYRLRGRAVMADVLARQQPRFVLANVESLDLQQPTLDTADTVYALLPEDFAVLRGNFVHHWGPIWVAGKRIALDGDTPIVTTDVLIAGRYVIESAGSVRIDGVSHNAGDIVDLPTGLHTVALDVDVVDGADGADGAGLATTVVLRTADALPPPAFVAPTERLFQPFRYKLRRPSLKH